VVPSGRRGRVSPRGGHAVNPSLEAWRVHPCTRQSPARAHATTPPARRSVRRPRSCAGGALRPRRTAPSGHGARRPTAHIGGPFAPPPRPPPSATAGAARGEQRFRRPSAACLASAHAASDPARRCGAIEARSGNGLAATRGVGGGLAARRRAVTSRWGGVGAQSPWGDCRAQGCARQASMDGFTACLPRDSARPRRPWHHRARRRPPQKP
jgi:hypothetical protein